MSADARPPRPLVTSLRPDALDDDAVARVAGVLAEAFLTDPYTVSFLPRSRRQERLTDMFDRVVRDTLRPDPARGGRAPGVVDVAVDPVDGTTLGAAVWDRPEAPRGVDLLGTAASAPRLVRVMGRHALGHVRTVAACERARPRVAHWYLRDVGARPSARGRGVARALVGRRQRDARQAGVGIYLESSTRANVPFYERLGFRETGPVTAHGTDDLTGMWWEA